MHPIEKQIKVQVLDRHFEKEFHHDISKLDFARLTLLSSEQNGKDVILVQYKNSPLMSFYGIDGRLLDIDAYLPNEYYQKDIDFTKEIAQKITRQASSKDPNFNFSTLLTKSKHINTFTKYLNSNTEMQIQAEEVQQYLTIDRNLELSDFVKACQSPLKVIQELLQFRYEHSFEFVHILDQKHIVIRSFDQSSGYAVIIETHDQENRLLHSDNWIITRSNNLDLLNRSLSFRTEVVKLFFGGSQYSPTLETDRYILKEHQDSISIDSLLDNTANVLSMPIVNNCYHTLTLDRNILGILYEKNQFAIVNAYNSIIPKKWLKKIQLPTDYEFARIDDNLNFIVAQDAEGFLQILIIEQSQAVLARNLGKFQLGFELTQEGAIICYSEEGSLVFISTNFPEIEIEENQENLNTVFEQLRTKLQGERLFEKISYPKKVTGDETTGGKGSSKQIDNLRYEFEATIEELLLETNDSYDKLLLLKEKIGVARVNIMEELSQELESSSLSIGGRRLSSIVNSIVNPTEKKVQGIINNVRIKNINLELKAATKDLEDEEQSDIFKNIINSLRSYSSEVRGFSSEIDQAELTEFYNLEKGINSSFQTFIDQEDSKLAQFILDEISEVETIISATNDLRMLEILLSTNPAAVELFTMLKQEFVLKVLGDQGNFSPLKIQKQLYNAVEKRKQELILERTRKKEDQERAKHQMRDMIRESISFFIENHSRDFSDISLAKSSNYVQINKDIKKIESVYQDLKLAADLRRELEYKIVEKNSFELARIISHEGKYSFVQNDADLYIDIQNKKINFPQWNIDFTMQDNGQVIDVSFIRDTDREKMLIDLRRNMLSASSFSIEKDNFQEFHTAYITFISSNFSLTVLEGLKNIYQGKKAKDVFMLSEERIEEAKPKNEVQFKALHVAMEKITLDTKERERKRNIPSIPVNYVDDTPYFQEKLAEFFIKAKIQLLDQSGILLLSGPPSTGKSAFLKFVAAITNREYFEHVSDKWQTKNSLVNSIKFGKNGPYSIPAGFTKAITTGNSIFNIEEIKEWPEALRKSLNPFFAGSKTFIAPDGTRYEIGENIILCAAANLGSFYRQDDEPFTSDFWSRIDVVEFDYAPEKVSANYIDSLFEKTRTPLTLKDMIRQYFKIHEAPEDQFSRTQFISKRVINFFLLPKADESIKKNTLEKLVNDYFDKETHQSDLKFSPEESAKIALRRLRQLSDLKLTDYYDLYNHFMNSEELRSTRLKKLVKKDPSRYNQYYVIFHCISHLEGCLRHLRNEFYSSAGRTEIEGTNREFIRALYLIDLLGEVH